MKLNVLGRKKTQMLTKLTLNCPVFSQKHELSQRPAGLCGPPRESSTQWEGTEEHRKT